MVTDLAKKMNDDGIVAMGIASSEPLMRALVFNRPVFWGLMIGELVLVFAFSAVAQRASFVAAAAMFLAFAALSGITFSAIFWAYTRDSIASVFFVTGGAFAGMSVYGTLTKKDLTSWGSFLMMGLIGVVIAGVVNLFLRNDAMGFIISCASVVIFTGLTAYDTQKLRSVAEDGNDNMALQGALMLYLDFINLFLALLRLFGRRR